jgi:hypothetical protein
VNPVENIPDDSEVDEWLDSRDPLVRRLAQEVRRLRDGIRQHRSQTGHSLCWLNDLELWRLLDTDAAYPHASLPVREEFLENCKRYYASRLEGTPWQDPPVKNTLVDKD